MTDQDRSPTGRPIGPIAVGVFVAVAVVVGVTAGVILTSGSGAGGAGQPGATDVAAGATPPSTPTGAPSPTPAPTPTLVPAPLTGLPVTETAAVQHPVAVMVDDHEDARPQSGFNSASIVWQAPAEGGIPRYMMIFQDGIPAGVGPIRSAREYFIDWASEWHAVYVHIGGSPQAMTTLRTSGQGQLVYNADGFRFDGSDMWRIKERFAPHNLYTDGAHLRAMAKAVGAPDGAISPVWQFGPTPRSEYPPTGTTIVLRYPYETITYRYDPAARTYRRYINDSTSPQIDAADGREVRPVNVVVLRMQFGPLNDGHPLKHRLEAQDVGSGEAIISTAGQVIHGTWKKAASDAPTLLYGPDGAPVVLAPGQTFVQVMALSYGYEIQPGTIPGTGIRQN